MVGDQARLAGGLALVFTATPAQAAPKRDSDVWWIDRDRDCANPGVDVCVLLA